jgi:Heavy-metal resistance
MLGFLVGTVCLIGLVKVVRRGRRWGYGHHHHFGGGPWGCGGHRAWRHGGGGWHGGPGGWEGRDAWNDEDDDFDRWEGRGGGRGPGFFGLRAVFARLDTTPGQEKAIKAAFEELRAKARGVKDDARGMRGDLATALRGESLDAETLGTVASRASGAVDALRDAAIGAVLKVHEVLDERQRAIAADLLESGPRFGRGWRGRGGPYRGGARV